MNKLLEKRLFLLDMDGTLYLGNRMFDPSAEFLDYLRRTGRQYKFLTNNSSRGAKDYISKLARMGISSEHTDFVTPVQLAVRQLGQQYADKKIYVLGTRSFAGELAAAGLRITSLPEADVACLILGYDTELTYQKLVDACQLLRQGVDYIATNPDMVCPSEMGDLPDCGTMTQMLKTATGRVPTVLGKPQPQIVYTAMEAAGCKKHETLIVGDRLYTDIACGINAGIDTALVFSGETTPQALKASTIEPTWTFQDVGELLRALQEADTYLDFSHSTL